MRHGGRPRGMDSVAATLRRLSLAAACLVLGACGQRDAFNHAADATPHQRELERAFAICAGCHDTRADLGHRVGPNLHGVIGRRAGDAAWPGPVWGHSAAEPYGPVELARVTAAARAALNLA